MPTRRGSQYSTQSDGGRLRSKNDPTKGKIPWGTEFIQGSKISRRQLPQIPIISEPELELGMSHSNRDKSHSEGSDRGINEPVQKVLHFLQGKILVIAATNTTRCHELLEHPPTVPIGAQNSEIPKWMESTIIQTSNKEKKYWNHKRREARKVEASVASTSKLQANQLPKEGKKNKK
ncbi:hypothetical protein O181_081867 [Austropuccinia psidii MF-1]|uniref:Uncharacterized protein n=1 Tax=Austropuccinia psidii MF-1 TaxID=1389203 RepID=A0A9Q3FPE0_9BASI|nr:hypothetical protein [Austropuccinia psidii MF-1]